MKTDLKTVARTGLCAALALLLGYVESLFPLPVPVPGVKLGLANIVVLCLLEMGMVRQAALTAFVRVLLSALLFSGFSGFVYALCGSIVSFAVMVFAGKAPLGTAGVSALGGAAHTMAQLVAAVFVTQTPALWGYAPVLLLSGVVTGFLTGIVGGSILRILPGALHISPRQAGKREDHEE